ncbi:MAG TPA: F0F1 ATP synthase subunit B [Verrucomicrobiae bacterium]|nr:F0F1 ATP synthase subunit B [Verrucomicrobiae bacterium]
MFETLGVKWPEFIAQLISFSLVFFVLNKFAFKRIAVVLAERRQKIAESLAGADKIKAEIARTEADRQKTLSDASETANKMIAEAREAAARVRESETQKAIAAAEQIVTKAREAAAQERAQMLAQLKREVGQLVVKTTATVTGKVLTAEDQTRLAAETQKQLS